MKKRYDDLTIAEIENLIKCKDKNGHWLCKRGCPFYYDLMCFERGFFNHFWEYCTSKNLVSEEDNDFIVEIESEDTE